MIVSLDSAAARDRALTGGKAHALARLIAARFPVPAGVVVTSVDDARTIELEQAVARLAAGAPTRFAVRSSGFSEDSVAASFAGQYETVLGVATPAEISSAIEQCFASLAGERSAAYASRAGARESGGAVIVQRLVEADAAGVAFTLDPVSGQRDRVVVDAAAGLGDAVVGGRVTPDGFVVAKDGGEILERRLGGPSPCIDDEQLRAVADLAQRVENHEGAPTDIEWALQGGKVYLLQARPVTTLARSAAATPPPGWRPTLDTPIDPRFPLYSRGNVGEILPGCVTPLTYSLFARGAERAFRVLAEELGSMSDVGGEPIVVGYFYHRLYLNVSYFMTAADNSPGSSRDAVYEELIGPAPSRHPSWTLGDLLPWNLWRGVRMLGRFLALQKRLDADIAATRKSYDELAARLASAPPAQWTNEALAAWIAADDAGLEPAVLHIRSSQFASTAFATLRGLTRRLLGDESGALAAGLVTGIGSLASASPAAALYDLAALAAADERLLNVFREERDDERLLARITATSVGPADAALERFREALSAFLDQFGHRGLRETDFRSLCWRERPSLVLGHVRQQLEPGSMSPRAIAERQAALSADAQERALAAAPKLRRGWLRTIIASARKHVAARETTKDLGLRFFELTRRVVAETQNRLGATLASPDDIHFLLNTEVAAALRGELGAAAITAIVAERRRDFDWSERIDVPKVQDGVATFETRRHAPMSSDAELVGVAVSPGIVEGLARVVLSPDDASLNAGDILVAPVTDVAWTPLFLRASALVVEVGGPLSHGSIVAREFGIPAVTAVTGATQLIRTGDRLRVDGHRGVVSIVRSK